MNLTPFYNFTPNIYFHEYCIIASYHFLGYQSRTNAMSCREWNENTWRHTHTHRFMQFYSSLKPPVMDRQLTSCLKAYLYCSLIHAKADRYWTLGRNRAWSNTFCIIMQGLLWGRDIVNIIQHSPSPLLSCLHSFLNLV